MNLHRMHFLRLKVGSRYFIIRRSRDGRRVYVFPEGRPDLKSLEYSPPLGYPNTPDWFIFGTGWVANFTPLQARLIYDFWFAGPPVMQHQQPCHRRYVKVYFTRRR